MLWCHCVHCCDVADAVPGSPPLNVRARPVSSNTVVVQWDEPKLSNGVIRVRLSLGCVMSVARLACLALVFTVISQNSSWLVTSRHVTSRHDTTRSTCRPHAFWLRRACRTTRLDTLVSGRTYRVVSRRDVTSQVEFGLLLASNKETDTQY